jgi:hypothetical protein
MKVISIIGMFLIYSAFVAQSDVKLVFKKSGMTNQRKTGAQTLSFSTGSHRYLLRLFVSLKGLWQDFAYNRMISKTENSRRIRKIAD